MEDHLQTVMRRVALPALLLMEKPVRVQLEHARLLLILAAVRRSTKVALMR